MLLVDYIGNRIFEEAEKKFVAFINTNKLQKILIECCRDSIKSMNKEFEEVIIKIHSDKIKPNLSVNELCENLEGIFKSLETNEKERKNIIENYKKRAYKEVLELYHIQESLDIINEGVKGIDNKINKNSEVLEKINKRVGGMSEEIRSEIKRRERMELHFIDELNYSKMYFYFEVEFFETVMGMEEKIDYIFDELEEIIAIRGRLTYEYDDFINKIYVEFSNPIQQVLFRNYLKEMDKLFCKNDISLFNIYIPY